MSKAAILQAMDRIVTLTAAATAPVLKVGQYYSIQAGSSGTRLAYFICDDVYGRGAIFGLQSPAAILAWLKIKNIHYIGNTPQDLMAVRSANSVTSAEGCVDEKTIVFQEMRTILNERNVNNKNESDECNARDDADYNARYAEEFAQSNFAGSAAADQNRDEGGLEKDGYRNNSKP